MNLLCFSVTSIFHVIIVEKHLIKHYFDTLSDLQFSLYVPIQLIPVGVERSNGTPTGTSCLEPNDSEHITEIPSVYVPDFS